MNKILKWTKKIGVALGITGTIVTATAYADTNYNNAEYTKAVVENFENTKVTNNSTTVADLKEKVGGNKKSENNIDGGMDGLDFDNGSWFQFDDKKGITATESYKVVPNGEKTVDIFNKAYLAKEPMAVEMFDILKQIDDDENLNDAKANEYIFTLLSKYAQKKAGIGVAYRHLTDEFKALSYRAFFQKLDKWDGKDKLMDLDNEDFDPFASVADDDVEESEKGLEESEKGLEESRQKLQAALNRLQKSKNRSKEQDEEIARLKAEINALQK